MTYAELNEQANHFAHYLKTVYSVHPDDLIALCLDRTVDILVSILGVLKAGAAYVPILPEYPDERIAFIVSDTNAKIVITNIANSHKLRNIISLSQAKIEVVDNVDMINSLKSYSDKNPQTKATSSNLAYVIYTSGTTGKSKGVMIEHRNVVNLFHVTDNLYKFNSSDVWTLFHSYAYDFSVWEKGNECRVIYFSR